MLKDQRFLKQTQNERVGEEILFVYLFIYCIKVPVAFRKLGEHIFVIEPHIFSFFRDSSRKGKKKNKKKKTIT